MQTHRNYVNGEWIKADDSVANINPSDISEVVGHYDRADTAIAEAAIAAARDALPAWAESPLQQRADLLDRIGTAIMAEREALAELLAREEGKTRAEATGEVVRAAQIFHFFAAEAVRLRGDRVGSVRPGVDVEVTREPVGVVGLITPWNFPIAIPAWKIAPALAYGNTVVLKPAELVPASAWELTRIIHEAGAPAGVFNLVMGRGAVVGEALTASPHVNAVSFTGSVSTGRSVALKCVESGKKVQLEMGGKNPLIVLEDADLDIAVEAAANGAFAATGQRCTASSRLIVAEAVHDRFVASLKERMAGMKVGHALSPDTVIGPVVDQRQLDQDLRYLDVGMTEGALLTGGERPAVSTEGYYLAPALFTDTTNDMRINREEIFGPVAAVIRVKDYEEALHTANDTEFGLSSGICTTSLKYATHFKRHSQAGMVMVNLPTGGVDYHVPFGGRKGSSYGPREQGSYAAEFYTSVKTAYTLA